MGSPPARAWLPAHSSSWRSPKPTPTTWWDGWWAMLVVPDAYNASDLPQGGVGAIGNFDGVHRGHRAILDLAVARAKDLAVPAVVVTFDPHPFTVLAPEKTPVPLTTLQQKERLLDE